MPTNDRHEPSPVSEAAPAICADLHIHTTASDGCWTPRQVVAGCRTVGIGLLAVADHDTVAHVLCTERLAQAAGLGFLRAVEVSTTADGRLIHILGYGIDPTDADLGRLLTENRASLDAAGEEDIRGLIELGYAINLDAYHAYSYDRTRGGFKSLNFCIDVGIAQDVRDFFENTRRLVARPLPDFAHPATAIDAIRGAGGVPVLAHPGASFADLGGVTAAALAPLLAQGIAGLECYSQYHDAATTAFCVAWCRGHDLTITGGSDYHGGYVGRQLGVPIIGADQLQLPSKLWPPAG